jgi:hypothetical protein
MAEEKDFFQKLSGEMLDFFEHVGDTLGDPLARDAVIRDLGGKPSKLPPPAPFPSEKLDAIKAYRDASHPSAEAAISAIADIAVVLDVIAGQIDPGRRASNPTEDLVHRLLEIMMSNLVRLRWPRLFYCCRASLQSKMPPRPLTWQQQSGQRRDIADGADLASGSPANPWSGSTQVRNRPDHVPQRWNSSRESR